MNKIKRKLDIDRLHNLIKKLVLLLTMFFIVCLGNSHYRVIEKEKCYSLSVLTRLDCYKSHTFDYKNAEEIRSKYLILSIATPALYFIGKHIIEYIYPEKND